MQKIEVRIEIPEEIDRLFHENSVEVLDSIRSCHASCEVVHDYADVDEGAGRPKDAVPLILASATAVSAVIYAVSRLIDVVTHRPFIAEWEELEELLSDGKIVKDKHGRPLMRAVRKHIVLEPSKQKYEGRIEFAAGIKGVKISFRQKSD